MGRGIVYILVFLVLLTACNQQEKTIGTKLSSTLTISDTLVPIEISQNKVLIKEGSYTPLYGDKNKTIKVKSFLLDIAPVTNADYLVFVKQNPSWRKSKAKGIFADGNYLKNWKNDTTLADNMLPDAPVTNVSWFAAKAYCNATKSRLPMLDEWEYVAMADVNNFDARKIADYNQSILNWYEKQNTFNNNVMQTSKNLWGVYDMHGLVWEWVEDFNAIMLSGENRGDVLEDKNLFCASGSIGATDLMNYAAFMRYAFRSSLKANYNVQNLGFRTVKTN